MPKNRFACPTISLLAIAVGISSASPSLAEDADASRLRDGAPAHAVQAVRLNSSGRDIPLGGPLLDNGFILGQVDYVLAADDRILIDAPQFLELLAQVLSPEAMAPLETALRGRSTVSSVELAQLGYPVTYDPATFAISTTIDPTLRPRQAISIAGGGAPFRGPVIEPASFSAYLTMFGNLDYVHRGFDRGLADPNLLFDSAIRLNNFVLENEASYQGSFTRQSTRLVYDDLARTARYAAGDLEPVARGFSGASPASGLSIERVYSDLDPQRNIQPRGQRSFTVTRASTVETFVNGTLVQQTRVNPGTYDVRDFPFAQGSNDIRLVVRDDTGRESVIDFSINFDRTLLAPGLSEFGLYAGVQTPFSTGGRRYTDKPVASGFYRRGITESFTAGGNFQATNRGGIAGVEAVWALPLGTLGFDLAASKVRNVGTGYAFNASFERLFASRSDGSSSLLATYQTISRNFATPDSLSPSNLYAHEFGITYSHGFALNHFLTADGFYSMGRGKQPDQKTARLGYGWRASNRLFLNAEAAYQDRGTRTDKGVRISLSYRFTPRSSMIAEVDSSREGGRLQYQTSSGRGVGSYNVQAGVDYYDGVGSVNGNANVLLNRAEVGVAHRTSYSREDNSIVDQRSSVRFGASVAYAGGSVSLGRPIYDSFALLAPHKSLKGAKVYVLPNDKEHQARSGAFGPGMASDLTAYTPQIITYDVPAAPLGYDLGPGVAQLMPSYRSGYRIEVGSSYSITFTGQLVDHDGDPVSLKAGRVYEVTEPKRPALSMFTNRAGRFAISGLRPGKWRIEAPHGKSTMVYFITVPSDSEGLVRAGTLQAGENTDD